MLYISFLTPTLAASLCALLPWLSPVYSGVSWQHAAPSVPGHVQANSWWGRDIHGGDPECIQPSPHCTPQIWPEGRILQCWCQWTTTPVCTLIFCYYHYYYSPPRKKRNEKIIRLIWIWFTQLSKYDLKCLGVKLLIWKQVEKTCLHALCYAYSALISG